MSENKQPEDGDLYVVKWRSRITGKESRGFTPLEYDAAMVLVDIGNKKFPDFYHWVEKYHGE